MMRKTFILILMACFFNVLLCAHHADAQQKDTSKNKVADTSKVYDYVQQQPAPPQGFMENLIKNIKIPAGAEVAPGVVYTSFIIEADGSLTNAKILRGMVGPDIRDQIVKLIQSGPKWKPGLMNGKAVRTRMTLPIRIDLK
jgi:hypothetical protein